MATRMSYSEANSMPRVLTMAAMFESQESPSNSSPTRRAFERRSHQTTGIPARPQHSPTKPFWSSALGSIWGQPGTQDTPATGKNSKISETTLADTVRCDDSKSKLRTLVSDSVAIRAAAIAEAEEAHQGPNAERPPLAGLNQGGPLSTKRTEDETYKDKARESNTIRSLGTMVPYQGQPPVAQHLNLARPASAASSTRQSIENLDEGSKLKRPGSTSFLHSQIRSLQKQLDAKMEEAAQLRRQLEAQEDSDIGTLSEQLRQTKREAQMWKDRAESAERRVKVFERFTARLKGIRAAAVVTDRSNEELGLRRLSNEIDDMNVGGNNNDQISCDRQHVRFVEGRRATEDIAMSEDSGHTEDAGTVTARIRKCLHGGLGGNVTGDGRLDDGLSIPELRRLSKAQSREYSMDAVEIWMAAQELLNDAQV